MLDDSAYTVATSKLFKQLLAAADDVDPDVLEADGGHDMVTFTATRTGEKVIVNTQRAVHQVWVAGAGEGVHFSHADDGRWLDDKGRGHELFAWIRYCVQKASGVMLVVH